MSSARYIELDSTYRNRNLWPLPAQFEILFCESGRKGKIDAADPVTEGCPLTSWTSNLVDANAPGPVVSGTVDSIGAPNYIAGASDNSTFIIQATAGELQQKTNYYKNLVLTYTSIILPIVTDERRIINYQYLGTDGGAANDRAIVTVSSPFGQSFQSGVTWTINDPTDLSNTSEPLIFVPDGRPGVNAYPNYYLYNETVNEYRRIKDYDAITHILRLHADTAPVTTWSLTDNYSIRRKNPIYLDTIAAGTTASSIVLTTGSPIDNFYDGEFIRIRAPVYGNAITDPENEVRRIITYDAATLTARVSPPFTAVPAVGSSIEILNFSYDNVSPLLYSGSIVSQQDMVCYEIELLNLSLPNKTLNCGEGSRIAFYPYVYVEISNVSSACAGMKNTIYSNNPNSTRMVFRAAIDDVANPVISSFIKVDGDGMVQTLKFKPNDNLRFSVHLSNGEIYRTQEKDNYSPYPPNLDIQISALFRIRRL